jgi:hypothetical protein
MDCLLSYTPDLAEQRMDEHVHIRGRFELAGAFLPASHPNVVAMNISPRAELRMDAGQVRDACVDLQLQVLLIVDELGRLYYETDLYRQQAARLGGLRGTWAGGVPAEVKSAIAEFHAPQAIEGWPAYQGLTSHWTDPVLPYDDFHWMWAQITQAEPSGYQAHHDSYRLRAKLRSLQLEMRATQGEVRMAEAERSRWRCIADGVRADVARLGLDDAVHICLQTIKPAMFCPRCMRCTA